MEESYKQDEFTTEHKMYVDGTNRKRFFFLQNYCSFFPPVNGFSNENIHDLISKQDENTKKICSRKFVTRNEAKNVFRNTKII